MDLTIPIAGGGNTLATMPVRAKNRRTRAERQLREKAELDVLLLQRELDLRQNDKPPLCRPETAQ